MFEVFQEVGCNHMQPLKGSGNCRRIESLKVTDELSNVIMG